MRNMKLEREMQLRGWSGLSAKRINQIGLFFIWHRAKIHHLADIDALLKHEDI
jgi:hypothetical protein